MVHSQLANLEVIDKMGLMKKGCSVLSIHSCDICKGFLMMVRALLVTEIRRMA